MFIFIEVLLLIGTIFVLLMVIKLNYEQHRLLNEIKDNIKNSKNDTKREV